MKKIIIGLIGVVLLAACSHEVDPVPLYHQFAARQDLTVAQVTGFQLCDTVKTDVVILVADDSAAWQSLKDEFNIRTSDGVTSWMGDINQPQQRVKRDARPAWRVMAVHSDRTVAFYRIDSEEQYDALLDYQLYKLRIEK